MIPNKKTYHHFSHKLFSLLLILLIINSTLSKFPKNNLAGRLLNEVQRKQGSIKNSTLYDTDTAQDKKTNKKNEASENPLTFLLGYYILFLILAIYLACLLRRSQYQYVRDLTSELYKFLYIANNGALFVTFINIVVVYENLGIATIIIGIIIFIAGSIFYFNKCRDKNFVEQCFQSETINKLFALPCLIWKLVCSTLYCCLCESSIIIKTTYIDAFGNKEVREEESCLPYLWNFFFIFFKLIITIFTILAYYIGLVLFCLFWFIAKLIYNKVKGNKANEGNDINMQSSDNNSNNVNQNSSNATSLNNHNIGDHINNNSNQNSPKPDYNNQNIGVDINKDKKTEETEDRMKNTEHNVNDRNNKMPTMSQLESTENLNVNNLNNNGENDIELNVKIQNEKIEVNNINQEGNNCPKEN